MKPTKTVDCSTACLCLLKFIALVSVSQASSDKWQTFLQGSGAGTAGT